MAISLMSAARAVCEEAGWNVSNLELQKLLYVSHMIHLGETGRPLINENFEAWDYGPVVPELYHEVKMFGRSDVRDVFFRATRPGGDALRVIRHVVNSLKTWTPGQLVAFTHEAHGAWAKNYRAGTRGIKISNADILAEYERRTNQ